ncbi:hypothetical protein I317_00961 [Kwoniella heveanensis CBS 569]|nr:hypothetical protein I317_00961 [Kwoniella heveanensis CBS 569]
MPGSTDEIVIISDTEEYHFIHNDDDDDEDEDDGIAFVGHGYNVQPRSRSGAVAGPSRITNSTPIFIDSDDEDDSGDENQDIHAFHSADVGNRPTVTSMTSASTITKSKAHTSLNKTRSQSATAISRDVGPSKAKVRAETSHMMAQTTTLSSSRRTKSLTTTATSTDTSIANAIDVDEYDDLTFDLDIQLVEAVMNNTSTSTVTASKIPNNKVKGKATAEVIEHDRPDGADEVVVQEVRSSGRAFEEIQDEFDRFESSLLDSLDPPNRATLNKPIESQGADPQRPRNTSQRDRTQDSSTRSSSAIKEAIAKEKAKLTKTKRKSSTTTAIDPGDPGVATQLKEVDEASMSKRRKKSTSNDDVLPTSTLAMGCLTWMKYQPAKKLSKEEKEALKAQEKAEKHLARETQKAAKEAEKSYQRKLAEVNRLRTSKNDTVREIHLYLSADLAHPTSPIAGALPEIKTRITDNHSELHFLPEDQSPINGVIRFKRHLKARWDSTKKQFIPLDQEKWIWEPSILMIINAEEIVDRIANASDSTSDDESSLSTFIADVRLTLGLKVTDQMMVMIKGLNKYYSKTKSLANKEFTAAARAGLTGARSGNGRTGPGATVMSSRPDKETIEMELVKLQVEERCFLVHVEKTEDIEDWVYNIAADVALRPYKLISKSHLNFCPTDSIKRKSSNPTEAFELMLQEVTGITPSAAMGIAVEYPTFYNLMTAYEKAERRGGVERAEGMLQDCQIKTLRDGTANGRKLNKALAKRVYNVFRGQDSLALA